MFRATPSIDSVVGLLLVDCHFDARSQRDRDLSSSRNRGGDQSTLGKDFLMMVVSFTLVCSGNTVSRGGQLEQSASLVSSLVAEPELVGQPVLQICRL